MERPTVLRTAQEREEYRKSLYKNNTCSPAWKSAYRKRCLERLKSSRESFLARYRHASRIFSHTEHKNTEVVSSVQEVMLEEWEQIRMEHANLPRLAQKRRASFPDCSSPSTAKRVNRDSTLSSGDEFLSPDEDIDYVLKVMDELTQELIQEEESILAQYEQDIRFDEDVLCAAIDCLSTNDTCIICPICQKYILHQNKHIIFCACGMRLDTAHDGITIMYIQKQLDECCSQHSIICNGKPVFSLETTLGMQNIIMNCTVCDFMEIII